jgi:hypothetical protein
VRPGATITLVVAKARFHDLGPGFYDTRNNADRTKRNHVRQLQALGYKVTLKARRYLAQAATPLGPGSAARHRVLPAAHTPSISDQPRVVHGVLACAVLEGHLG